MSENNPLLKLPFEIPFDRIEAEFEALDAAHAEKERQAGATDATEGPVDQSAGDRDHAGGVSGADESADMLDEEESFPARSATEALVESKLERIAALRERGADAEARTLLYEVLAEGNVDQVRVARNILAQLDD